MAPDFGLCPACDKPRKSGQYFVPEFDGLKAVHEKCAMKLGMKQPEMVGGPEYFDPATGNLLPAAPPGCPAFPGQAHTPDSDQEPPESAPPGAEPPVPPRPRRHHPTDGGPESPNAPSPADAAALDGKRDDVTPPPRVIKHGRPTNLVRAPAGCTTVATNRADGSALVVTFKNGEPKWVDDEEALAVVQAGGLIEDRK